MVQTYSKNFKMRFYKRKCYCLPIKSIRRQAVGIANKLLNLSLALTSLVEGV